MITSIPEKPHLVIAPAARFVPIEWGSIWHFRELLYFLAWRDVKIRYKQTLLGVAWAVLQPLLTMIVFTLFFGKVANIPSNGHPYALFAYAGLLPWTFFANAVTNSGNSLVQSSHLISKVYFPRLIVPASTVLAGLVDLLVSTLLLFVLFAIYRHPVEANILMLPVLVLIVVTLATAVGTFFSALNVKYRDVRYALPFLIQITMFATPIIYPLQLVPERWRWLVALNPMAPIVEGFRTALLGGDFDYAGMAAAFAFSLVLLLVCALYFRSVEREFADLI